MIAVGWDRRIPVVYMKLDVVETVAALELVDAAVDDGEDVEDELELGTELELENENELETILSLVGVADDDDAAALVLTKFVMLAPAVLELIMLGLAVSEFMLVA